MLGRLLTRLLDAQDVWARPLGDAVNRVLAAIFRPIRPIKDLLNGTWLGHPLHPAITDVPIGAFLVALVLDVGGVGRGALLASIVGQLAFIASAVTGLGDYTDTDGRARTRATVHGLMMLIGGALTAASLVLRVGTDATGGLPLVLLAIGFLVIAAGAYVGGDVVYLFGNMVSRHAFRGAGTKWVRLETADGVEPDALPELVPARAKLGINTLVLVREGATVHALHDTCAHAAGSLSDGKVADGCVECPVHGARYRLRDGRVVRGPALYDQPAYEVRRGESGWEGRRVG
ncbi:MAG TPA: Rieske (2Fe-2S) protein [Candidatus Sulfomarinibacteraceae bacterium]|nr:Rieske (2Fe-2S) protein [Candidatus Sulfomarinibacteraceae bacterium]